MSKTTWKMLVRCQFEFPVVIAYRWASIWKREPRKMLIGEFCCSRKVSNRCFFFHVDVFYISFTIVWSSARGYRSARLPRIAGSVSLSLIHPFLSIIFSFVQLLNHSSFHPFIQSVRSFKCSSVRRPSVVRPSVRPFNCSSVRPSVRPFNCSSVRPSVSPFVQLFVRPSVRPSVRPFVQLFARQSVRSIVRPSVRQSIRPIVRPSVRQSIRPIVRPSVRQSVRSIVRPSLHSYIFFISFYLVVYLLLFLLSSFISLGSYLLHTFSLLIPS